VTRPRTVRVHPLYFRGKKDTAPRQKYEIMAMTNPGVGELFCLGGRCDPPYFFPFGRETELSSQDDSMIVGFDAFVSRELISVDVGYQAYRKLLVFLA